MKVLMAGGTGFLGTSLRRCLESSGHQVQVLTRGQPATAAEIHWDGRSPGEWTAALESADAVVHATGHGLDHWPWSGAQKQRFIDSRVLPGKALAEAIAQAKHKPGVFLQFSGIHFYGSTGDGIADESYPAAADFLAQMSVQWEGATFPVEQAGVRRVIARNAVVLDSHGGLFPLMALPVRLFVGGPIGSGRQAVSWIHIQDAIEAMRFLLENEAAAGAYNLVAPQQTSDAEFMRTIARALRRPYWFPTPGFLLRLALGEMSTLVLDGRYAMPKRLIEAGFRFRYPTLEAALGNLFPRAGVS